MATSRAVPTSNHPLPVLSVTDLSFGPEDSVAVVSQACKFVIPVPVLGQQAEPLVYPSGHPQQGQAIVDYKGRQIGDYGIVFFNEKDQSWQAALADGTGVIIVNEVLPTQAAALDHKIGGMVNALSQLTLSQLKEILIYACSEMGLCDVYNSTRAYVSKKLIALPIPDRGKTFEDDCYGFKKRDAEDVYRAIYIPGAFKVEGTAATEQIFENGGVMIEQDGDIRGVQPEIFVRTYCLADGQPIQSPIQLMAQLT